MSGMVMAGTWLASTEEETRCEERWLRGTIVCITHCRTVHWALAITFSRVLGEAAWRRMDMYLRYVYHSYKTVRLVRTRRHLWKRGHQLSTARPRVLFEEKSLRFIIITIFRESWPHLSQNSQIRSFSPPPSHPPTALPHRLCPLPHPNLSQQFPIHPHRRRKIMRSITTTTPYQPACMRPPCRGRVSAWEWRIMPLRGLASMEIEREPMFRVMNAMEDFRLMWTSVNGTLS